MFCFLNMKIIVKKFFILMVYFVGVSNLFAAPTPPAPGYKRPPPPPGLPIDENQLVILIITILLGIFIIYQKSKKPLH